jgi:predicted nucleic acid-binding protein
MLRTRWSAEAWSQVRLEFKRALALRSDPARGVVQLTPLKVYADQNVVSALWRQDQRREENAAILVVKEWSDAGRITLVVSDVHDRERPLPEQYRDAHEAIRAALPRVEFADDHQLYGFNTVYSGPGSTGGFITHPLIEDDKVARRLREIGLDRLDAHHVMLAVKRECAAFVTCDEATILKYRTQVEAEFSIPLTLPSEFIQRYRYTVDPRGPKGK